MQHHGTQRGMVYIVGAGPGDPGLITVRGSQCLHRADLVLCDYLVNPALLEHVRPTAEIIRLGHHGGGRTMPQAEIESRMVRAAQDGKIVVRLKGGDPAVFARGAEESAALAAADIPFEIVPGVSAALAAAGYVGIPITHAEHSSAVALVTGQQRHGKETKTLNYAALAGFPGTLIFYMGVTSAARWSQALMAEGKSPDTRVMIVLRCTWSNQRVVRATLGTVADEIARQKLRPPAVIVVGDAAALAPEVPWSAMRPLSNVRVVVTRPRQQAGSLAEQLIELGADVLFQPAICIAPPPDWKLVDAAIAQLDRYDWLVFSSVNGVQYFLDRLIAVGGDLRRLGSLKLAAIGPGTADELARCRLHADRMPDEYRAENLAAALNADARGRRFLLARASRGREVLAETLRKGGADVDQVVVYENRDIEKADEDVARHLATGGVDWMTVTSSTIARSLVRLFGEDLHRTKLASISPITSGVLSALGHVPAVEAEQYTIEGVVRAIVSHEMAAKATPP